MNSNSQSTLQVIATYAALNGQQKELRSFACWCARQTKLEGMALTMVEMAENFIMGQKSLTELQILADQARGAGIAAGTIGFNHKFPNAPAFLCAYQTLSPNALGAALSSAVFQRYYANFEDGDWNMDKENQLCQEQIWQLLEILSLPFPGRVDKLRRHRLLN